MAEREALPLTAEELTAMRERYRTPAGYDGPITDAERLLATLDAARSVPDEGALRAAIAYAIARAPVPSKMDTAGDVAARLAPLVIESGYLSATPKDEPDAPLDVSIEELASALYETDPPETWMRTSTAAYRERAESILLIVKRDRAALSKESTGG